MAEGVPALLPHALHLADLADGLLELFHAGPVVLDVVLLDLLHVVIGLRAVHALGVLPRDVAEEAECGEDDEHEPEDGRSEEPRDDTVVFRGEAEFRRDGAVDGDEDEPDDHAAGDGEEGPLRPDVGDERGFSEYGRENGGVEGGAPNPVSSNFTV